MVRHDVCTRHLHEESDFFVRLRAAADLSRDRILHCRVFPLKEKLGQWWPAEKPNSLQVGYRSWRKPTLIECGAWDLPESETDNAVCLM